MNPWTVTEGGAAARPTIVFLRGRHHRADVGRSPERFADHQCLAPDLPCQAPFTTARYRHTRAMVASQRLLLDWGGVSRRHLNLPGCPRVPLSFSMPQAARLTFPSILPKSDA